MKPNDYEMRAALARRDALREESGWRPPNPKPTPKPRPKPAPKPKADLGKVAFWIMGAVSDCVPDGDPIDRLAPMIRKMLGINSYYGWGHGEVKRTLDKACRAHLHCKSYDQYLINAWDSWNEICAEDQRMDNPWRPTKPQRKVAKRNHK
jgi:hypothetical protein